MPWILFLDPFTKCAHSVRIRIDTTLDQDCVLKASVHVCTACMIVSLLATCMNFITPPLAQVAPFRYKIRESNAEATLDTKLSKHVCQLILVCQLHLDHSRVSKRPPRLVYKHSMVPTRRLLSLSSSRVIGVLKVLRESPTWRQAGHKIPIACCNCFALALLICSCFAHCCHDPFIVKSASNLSTVPWFHSV